MILYGWHTVKAALENPARRIRRLYATENAARRLAEDGVALAVEPELVRPDAIARRLGPDAVHQGLLAEADPLPSPELEELEPAGIVLVLDQITDPHNVGAILRTAAAFAVDAVVTTARHSPEATGVLAKSASGALEYVPIVTVQNLARALAALRERGYLLVGLDSTGDARPRRGRAARAARARAGRRGQGTAAIDARDLRPGGAARSSGPDQEPQRLECGGAGALCGEQTDELTRFRDVGDACAAPRRLEGNQLLVRAQCGRHRRCIQTFGEFVMDVAQRHPQVIANGRVIGSAQLLVDGHQIEIGVRPRFANVEGALRRMQADELEPARKLGARLAPRLLAERRRDRIAVEDGENERTERIELRDVGRRHRGRSTPSTNSATMASPSG